jgi:hypothetical protein
MGSIRESLFAFGKFFFQMKKFHRSIQSPFYHTFFTLNSSTESRLTLELAKKDLEFEKAVAKKDLEFEKAVAKKDCDWKDVVAKKDVELAILNERLKVSNQETLIERQSYSIRAAVETLLLKKYPGKPRKMEEKLQKYWNEDASLKQIWGTFFTFAGGKIANTIFRFYALISGMGASPFYWSFSSYVDIYLLFTSIYVDIICCLAMYQTSKGLNLASKKLGDIMKLIKTSSLLRIGIMTCVKLLVGGYWLTTVCIEDYAICPTGWLRNITITVEYQLYYLDYLLTRNCSGVSEQTTKMTSITSNMSNS